MKPEASSRIVFKYTQSIAKAIEFDVPENERKKVFPHNPEKLFSLTIGMLGDLAARYMDESPDYEKISEQEEDLRFCATFFDNYKNTERMQGYSQYILFLGATSYYLCNLQGSSKVLLNKIDINGLELTTSKLEKLLYWVLQGDYQSDTKDLISIKYYEYEMAITNAITHYFFTGEQKEKVKISCSSLRECVYKNGSDRELLLCDSICAVAMKKIKNSCWENLPYMSDLPIEKWKTIITKATFIKELWPSQLLLGKEGVFKGQSSVIQMPTSAGKTKSTEIIIRSAFLSERTSIATIVAPFRALCNEIKQDFYKSFAGENNIVIDELNDVFESSELKIFLENRKKHIIIVTPEKLYYLLSQQQEFASQIGLIIFDEGHQFDAGKRGITYELLLTELKRLLPLTAQRILISAVIGNAEQIAKWLSADEKVVSGNRTLPTQRSIGFVNFNYGAGQINFVNPQEIDNDDGFVPKVIPISELPRINRERKVRKFPISEDSNSVALYLAIKMSQKSPVAIFCGRKDSVNKIGEYALDLYKRVPLYSMPIKSCNQEESVKLNRLISLNLGNENSIFKASEFGIYMHHADIPYGIKMSIEYALHTSKINFIVCTSTLAQGVNIPIKYLFVTSTMQAGKDIKVRDFQNLIGRVARAGKVTEGSIIFTDSKIDKSNIYYWNKIKRLLNSDLSENCTSSLLSIFEPFYYIDKNDKEKGNVNVRNLTSLVHLYYETNSNPKKLAEIISSKYPKYSFDILVPQITRKYELIESVENFLMILNISSDLSKIEELAKSTLAYNLANESQKEEIVSFFQEIANRINIGIQDTENIPIYGKTLKGLNQISLLKDNLKAIINNFLACDSSEEMLDALWQIMDEHISGKVFKKYGNRDKLKNSLKMWIAGNNYNKLFSSLEGEKVGTQNFKIEHCIELFESDISYNGAVLVNSITELLPLVTKNDCLNLTHKLLFLQKQIKYGLPNIESVMLYELGFCDRIVSQSLSKLVYGIDDKIRIKQELALKETEVNKVLQEFPYFYGNVYKKILDSIR